MPPPSASTGISITNPLVLYRSLLSTNRIQQDPAQHRLAIHLQTLYNRLKDYEPVAQYGHRLQQLQRALGSTPANPAPNTRHGVPRQGILSSLFEDTSKADGNSSMALTRVLTSHEEAMRINSPKGLLLHGDVGTGKSMLVDLFAECLPTRKKRRYHYNTFMLEILAKLERLRRSRELIIPASLGEQQDYSLLWLARELISSSPILFLDEFQLPDRAAAKLLTNLMTCFFQLGGVLIATSNRMPEELDKAARLGFAPVAARTGLRGLGLRMGGDSPSRRSEFGDFLDLLRARCDVWQMESTQDYRRSEASESREHGEGPSSHHNGLEPVSAGNLGLGWEQSKPVLDETKNQFVHASVQTPRFYHLSDDSSSDEFFAAVQGRTEDSMAWSEQILSVYGRPLRVPRAHGGVVIFTFDEICSNALGPTAVLGPADYTTLASHFHTFIVKDVPTLSLLQKNEARRLITLLDALYEARCKLAISAKAAPDYLFFPETLKPRQAVDNEQHPTKNESVDQDATYSETLSEIYQDTTAPFRPNVSSYTEAHSSSSTSDEADATHARFAGLFDDDRAQQQRELSRKHDVSSVDVGDAKLLGHRAQAADTTASMLADTESGFSVSSKAKQGGPDFMAAGAFTGEDEKFAFRRAQSRLWELCSARWWAREHESATVGDGVHKPSWWRPLSSDVRVWERPRDLILSQTQSTAAPHGSISSLEGLGPASSINEESDAVLFKHGATSPFRTSTEPPPKFSWTHTWGMMRWGTKAGRWGQGTDAFKDREKPDNDHASNESAEQYQQRRKTWREQESK